MLQLAFCDDDLSELQTIQTLLDRYRVARNQEIRYTAFQNAWDLLAEVERGTRYDVLLLDVLMPGQNGIEVAGELRQYDNNVKIIFLTSSPEFAVQSYAVGAYFYQLKPIWEESFYRIIDAALEACRKEQSDSLILRCKTGITRVALNQLEYCEVIHRTLLLHLDSGKVLESSGSLDELSRQLAPYGCFYRPHRSYLVNLEYVQTLSYRAITLACLAEIPIPRGKYNEVKSAFLDYAFQKGQVTV